MRNCNAFNQWKESGLSARYFFMVGWASNLVTNSLVQGVTSMASETASLDISKARYSHTSASCNCNANVKHIAIERINQLCILSGSEFKCSKGKRLPLTCPTSDISLMILKCFSIYWEKMALQSYIIIVKLRHPSILVEISFFLLKVWSQNHKYINCCSMV